MLPRSAAGRHVTRTSRRACERPSVMPGENGNHPHVGAGPFPSTLAVLLAAQVLWCVEHAGSFLSGDVVAGRGADGRAGGPAIPRIVRHATGRGIGPTVG